MKHHYTTLNTKLLNQEIDELERLVHRIRERISLKTRGASKVAQLQEVWKRTAGILSHKRTQAMLRYVVKSRKEWDEQIKRSPNKSLS